MDADAGYIASELHVGRPAIDLILWQPVDLKTHVQHLAMRKP